MNSITAFVYAIDKCGNILPLLDQKKNFISRRKKKFDLKSSNMLPHLSIALPHLLKYMTF